MWLINTATLTLECFHGHDIPAYAILSHTWGLEELSFEEFQQQHPGRGKTAQTEQHETEAKAGYRKIVATCARARHDGCLYAWVDTCCIDKTSSAELTEAINSMFRWYRDSRICYALLSDLDAGPVSDAATESPSDSILDQHRHAHERLRHCRWFTRGWCLQELLAPLNMRFFNARWQEVGTKNTLGRTIARITGIPEAVLVAPQRKDIHHLPLARRISWMAKRHTTRIEDRSYALLGILGIHMPMLYGEGEMAFQRLQEEVIRKYNDLSVFAWTGGPRETDYMPVLASSPSDFARNAVGEGDGDWDDDEGDDDDVRGDSSNLGDKLRTQFSLTNQGVYFPSMRLYCQNGDDHYRYHYLLMLNYRDPSFRGIRDKHWYIALQKVGPGLFVRIHETSDRRRSFRTRPILDPVYESVCLINRIPDTLSRRLTLWERHAVRLRWKPWPKSGRKYWNIRATEPRANWDLIGGQFLVEMASEEYMHVVFVPGNYQSNPRFEYFVLVMQVGGMGTTAATATDSNVRDSRQISVRVVNSHLWPGVNETPFQFAAKESLALMSLPPKSNSELAGPERISLVGYDICVSVKLVVQDNGVPYHLVFLDWKKCGKRIWR
ncbi:hypothetical protein E4U21_005578 [Claviceps maximensis]|nr:hypothetical protein E4U21_005578 [Claviceps maximensis]